MDFDIKAIKAEILKLQDHFRALQTTNKLKNYNEAQTRNEFIEPLFSLLGWDMRNKSGRNDVTTEESISNGRVDLAFRVNGLPVMLLEAKAIRENLDDWKFAKQAMDYCWNKGVSWAILTDFEGIKVFNAELPPIDVRTNLFFEIKWTEYIDKFEQLWLLSYPSMEKRLLDEQAKKWGKKAAQRPVDQQLLSDLLTSRGELERSVTECEKDTDPSDLKEGIQRIIDRVIFIRIAEDRRITENHLKSICRSTEKKSAYKRLCELFRDFDKNFNSKLFQHHFSEEWNIPSEVVKQFISSTYDTPDGYTYDFSAITSDIVGKIYEQYLSIIQKDEDLDADIRTRRRDKGIFYTPVEVVAFIVKTSIPQSFSTKELRNFKILDPACGSGAFLIQAYEHIAAMVVNKQDMFAKFDILRQNLFGIDIDAQAIELAQLNLLTRVLEQKTLLPTLTHNLIISNSLIQKGSAFCEEVYENEILLHDKMEDDQYDVIIGNPPYIYSRSKTFDDRFKEYIGKEYNHVSYQANTYTLFVERAHKMLKEGGVLGFIIPINWVAVDTAKSFRKFIFENSSEVKIYKCTYKVFEDANVDTCILFLKKGQPTKSIFGLFNRGGSISDVFSRTIKQIRDNNYVISFESTKEATGKASEIEKNSFPLKKIATVKNGLKKYEIGKGTPPQTESDKNDDVFFSQDKLDKSYLPFLNGGDVKRFAVKWSAGYLKYGSHLAAKRDFEIFKGERILVRQITNSGTYKINAAYTEEILLNEQSIHNIININPDFDPFMILGVINSLPVSEWLTSKYGSGDRKLFPRVIVKNVEDFPIPLSRKFDSEISTTTKKLIQLTESLENIRSGSDRHASITNEILNTQEKLNALVGKAFSLK